MNVTFNNHKQGIVAVELISASPLDDETLMIVSVASVPFVRIFPSHDLSLLSQSVWGPNRRLFRKRQSIHIAKNHMFCSYVGYESSDDRAGQERLYNT